MANHSVKIQELQSGGHSVVDPGIVLAAAGDTIAFSNGTGYQVKLLFAEGGVLDGVQSMEGKVINADASRTFTVLAAPPEIYEYVVSVKLKKGKRVFAVGSSTPKIIVRP